jgi:hypothetical protein
MRLMWSPLSFYGERGGENWEVGCKQHCKCLWWKWSWHKILSLHWGFAIV